MIEPDDDSERLINIGHITARKVSFNTDIDVIVTTEDKLKLVLSEWQHFANSRDAWIAPAGILISMLITVVTADFRKILLEAAVWQAIFYVTLVLVFGWLLRALWKRPKNKSRDDFIRQIKNSEQ